ncbi:2496_t:CDS:2 [Ambispora gerdemannii]|uniref:2496_t:CDS:1 n=1 Tax=Ambispora gerdemannii TaxID=144530 RepID=A0A9N9BEF6_9GLOM|nr:2496_t:CDS:2 [Ambispora gerdemannii]
MAPLTSKLNDTKRQIKKRKIHHQTLIHRAIPRNNSESTDVSSEASAAIPTNIIYPLPTSTSSSKTSPYPTKTPSIMISSTASISEATIRSFKPFIVPTVLIIAGFCLLTFLCCCVRWNRFSKKNKKVESLEKEKKNLSMYNGKPAVIVCGGVGNHRCSNCGTVVTDESEGSEDDYSNGTMDENEWMTKRKSDAVIVTSPDNSNQRLTIAKNKNLDNSKLDRRVSFKVDSKEPKKPKSSNNQLGIRLAANSPTSQTSQSAFTEIVETEADNKPISLLLSPSHRSSTDNQNDDDDDDVSSIEIDPKSPSASPLQSNNIPSSTINNNVDDIRRSPSPSPSSSSQQQRKIPSGNNSPTLRASSGSSTPIAVMRPANRSTTSLIMQQNNIYASRTLVFPLPPNTNHN